MKKLVFIGPGLTVRDPKSFTINLARRGEVRDAVSLNSVAALAVATDDGDDFNKQSDAAKFLMSFQAGALLVGSGPDGDFTRRDVLKVRGRLEQRGFWGEALGLWCGAAEAEGDWITREEATARAVEARLIENGSDPLKNNPKWAAGPFRRTGENGVEYEWGGLLAAWRKRSKKPIVQGVKRVA